MGSTWLDQILGTILARSHMPPELEVGKRWKRISRGCEIPGRLFRVWGFYVYIYSGEHAPATVIVSIKGFHRIGREPIMSRDTAYTTLTHVEKGKISVEWVCVVSFANHGAGCRTPHLDTCV